MEDIVLVVFLISLVFFVMTNPVIVELISETSCYMGGDGLTCGMVVLNNLAQ